MFILFKQLEIGDKFHDGIYPCSGINKGKSMYSIYEKIDKSHAKCINQIGWGNTREVGKIKNFYANNKIWKVTDEI